MATMLDMTTNVVIAEFGGKCYMATRPTTVVTEPRRDELGGLLRVYGATVACGCGATMDWTHTPTGDPFVYRYYQKWPETGPAFHLVIVRVPDAVPPCEHWMETVLTL